MINSSHRCPSVARKILCVLIYCPSTWLEILNSCSCNWALVCFLHFTPFPSTYASSDSPLLSLLLSSAGPTSRQCMSRFTDLLPSGIGVRSAWVSLRSTLLWCVLSSRDVFCAKAFCYESEEVGDVPSLPRTHTHTQHMQVRKGSLVWPVDLLAMNLPCHYVCRLWLSGLKCKRCMYDIII